jgi:uncharacterized protein (DUF58 family)
MFTFPRKFVPTKSGWIFFGFMLAIVVFAYTTNNNLLFLLFSAMMSLMVMSGMMSESSLGRIGVTRHFPYELFARRPFTLQWEFHNHARRIGAYLFYANDKNLLGSVPGPLVVRLAPGETRKLLSTALLSKRGRYRLAPFRLVTQYPFLLFTKSREIIADEEVTVYPAIRPVSLSWEQLFGAANDGLRERREDGDRFSYLREYEPGMPLRKVDWKKSAKLDELYVKEFDRAETRRVAVRFEPGRAVDYEPGLEVTASVLVWLFNHQVPFALAVGDLVQQRFDDAPSHLREGLTALALFESAGNPAEFDEGDRGITIDADGRFHIR